MKKPLLIVLIGLFSFQSFAQDPDPELFRTWYLYFVQSTDLGTPYEVSEIDPPIQPYITILEDLSFNGEGACNTFEGSFSYENPNILFSNTFNETNEDCGIQIHNSFENSFFGLVQGIMSYSISQESDGLMLYFDTILMGSAILRDYPLSTSDFNLNTIKLYPNPVSETLNVFIENNVIEKMVVYSINGEIVIEQNYNQNNSIDVSLLSKGMYFVEIFTSEGKTVKKFIKE